MNLSINYQSFFSYQSTSYKPTKPPVYKPAPASAPTYHSAPAPSYAPAPAPAYAPGPPPSYHKPEPAYQPEPSYGPSHNCSVQVQLRVDRCFFFLCSINGYRIYVDILTGKIFCQFSLLIWTSFISQLMILFFFSL